MKRLFGWLSIATYLLAATSCKDKTGSEDEIPNYSIEVTLEPYFNDQPLVLNETVFTTDEGYRVKLREFRAIFTDVGTSDTIPIQVATYNLDADNVLFRYKKSSAGWNNLRMNLGVPESVNHSDPSAFPNNHPLNIVNAGSMHWSWNPGYIFFKIEMLVDTTFNDVDDFNLVVSYHVGMDDCFREIELPLLNWNHIGDFQERSRLKFDFHTLLNNSEHPIDIKEYPVTHSAPEQLNLSKQLADNFVQSVTAF